MNKPEKLQLKAPPGHDVLQEGGRIVFRRVVDVKKFRAAAAAVLAHMPAPRKGASVLRELRKSRLHRAR